MNISYELLERFAPVLRSADTRGQKNDRLLIDRDGEVSIYYAPFEYVNPAAKVVLVGITPGPTQMANANRAAVEALAAGKPIDEVCRAAKDTGAFSGELLRGNLIRQLNHWQVHRWLGLDNAADLFSRSRSLVQTTSLLRFPVFVGKKPYAGSPDMTRHPLLRRHLLEHFAREVDDLPGAVFITLGPTVQRAMQWLIEQGRIPRHRVALGMLHPSPNCTYRINYLTGDRLGAVPHATNPVQYDEGRDIFRKTYLND